MQNLATGGDQQLEYAALSDVGLRRSNNQDSLATVLTPQGQRTTRGCLFLVADGMGAHAAGELASRMAAETIPHVYYKLQDRMPAEALREAILEGNTSIHERGEINPEFHGMGTTASALVVLPDAALVGHVGDSRIYRLRGWQLEQWTFDHSLVWEMTASGQLAKDGVGAFIPRNIITRSLGPNVEVQVDLEGPIPIQPGDVFLLCSDGLSGQVADREIGAVLLTLPPAEAVRALVDLANLRGGPDNITVIAVQIKDTGRETTEHALPERPRREATGETLAGWAVCAGGLLGSALMFALHYPTLGAASLVLGIGGAIWAAARYNRGNRVAGESVASEQPLGKGPYVTVDCQPDQALAAEFARLAGQLREAASEEKWQVPWQPFEAHQRAAVMAAERHDFASAVREHAQAISFMLGEVRKQSPGKLLG